MKFNAEKARQLETSKKLYYKPELQQTEKGRKKKTYRVTQINFQK